MVKSAVFKIKLKKDDLVLVNRGKDKGKTGKVIATHPRLNKVTVEGVNLAKRHLKISSKTPNIVEVTKPIWVHKLTPLDPVNKQPVKIKFVINSKGKKERVLKPKTLKK